MMFEGLDPAAISKLLSQQVEQVTCTECCKYFIVPETAACGHTLCHSCWKGRRACYTCDLPVNKKALKVNLPLQTLTEHIHCLADAFEKLFNVKLEEFTLEILDELQSEDPTKNVKEWLASSENQFSAPVASSQMSDHNIQNKMELSKSKIQVNTHNKKLDSPVKVVHPPQPQDDWDKIEVLPDTEEIAPKQKDLGVGPMDIEPFFIDEYEYTTQNPRRSSRKKEKEDSNSNPPTIEASVDKNSAKNSSETKSLRNKQNWSNVKKMRKEFSKLNKINRSKLNVSIEMCKKAKAANKQKATPPQTDSEKNIVNIDENTPVINVSKEKGTPPKQVDSFDNNLPSANIINDENLLSKHTPLTDDSKIKESKGQISGAMEVDVVNKSHSSLNRENLSRNNLSRKNIVDPNKGEEGVNVLNKENVQKGNNKVSNSQTSFCKKSMLCNPSNMPFLKKSALYHDANRGNDVQIIQKEIESNTMTSNTDDIEISIRIGKTVTNIVLKNKKNDVQTKVNTDQGIQTSLGPYGLVDSVDKGNSPVPELNVQNIELNIQENNKVTVNKSFSTKKNTASADTVTATAQFEITDSMERELSDVMECLEKKRKKTQNLQRSQLTNVNARENAKESQQPSASPAKVTQVEVEQNVDENQIPDDMEDLNDEDIFNSGSVKEGHTHVKLLKDAGKPASEILMPTNKSKKTQNVAEKRDRDTNDSELPSSKRQKIVLVKNSNDKEEFLPSETQEKEIVEASDSANYDIIMSQVFANIDADIKSSNKHIGKPTQTLKQKSNESGSAKHSQTQSSQIIQKTLNVSNHENRSGKEKQSDKEITNEKYSENVFSMIDKDSEPVEKIKNNGKIPEVTTQQHIDNLLTPGMCRDLVGTHVTDSQKDREEEIALIEPIQGTPIVDNDDDIVEETPQKNVSFAKPKQSDAVKTLSNTKKKLSRKANQDAQTQDFEAKSDSQIIKSIINISDTTLKDTTVVEAAVDAAKRPTLETPLTINKFVDHIKHNSTPVARKSLNFDSEMDDEQTICPTTTQEKEIIAEAFKQTQISPVKRPLGLRNHFLNQKKRKFFVAGSCLSSGEVKNLKMLCQERGWTYLDKYSKELTHLVVGVDDENKSQRSVKYMCALAASKWIVSYAWVEKCLQLKSVVDELPYEALDAGGEAGPRRSRTAIRKVFEGVTFYCMPPFSVLDIDTLKQMLESAGGRVVQDPKGVKVSLESGSRVLLLLAEPEHTQEDRFVYLAIEHSVVPVNYEWALNCLGTYSLCSIQDLLLCPSALLPPATSNWPAVLLMREEDYD